MSTDNLLPLLDDVTAEGIAPRPQDRDFVESLWQIYSPFAERDFRPQFLIETQKRFWEMYLTCALLRQGKNVFQHPPQKKPRLGPDVKVIGESKVVWLEAVLSTSQSSGWFTTETLARWTNAPSHLHHSTRLLVVRRDRQAIAEKARPATGYADTTIMSQKTCIICGKPFDSSSRRGPAKTCSNRCSKRRDHQTDLAYWKRRAAYNRERVRAWRKKNPQMQREQQRAYRAAHRAELNAYKDEYCRRNPERARRWKRNTLARKLAGVKKIGPSTGGN